MRIGALPRNLPRRLEAPYTPIKRMISGMLGSAIAWSEVRSCQKIGGRPNIRAPCTGANLGFALADVARAHRVSESGHGRGRLVLEVPL